VGELSEVEDVRVHNLKAATVAHGLVEQASKNGGVVVIGASRDRRLRQWVFGSTPDAVVRLAEKEGVPVIVYASSLDAPQKLKDFLFPVYRYIRKFVGRSGATTDVSTTPEAQEKRT